jgi:hypothetical protein
MANAEQLAILEQGVEVWNQWRERNTNIAIDLSGADLREAMLFGANLFGTDLTRADLTGAVLTEANLGNTNLLEAKFSRAILDNSVLGDADLNYADLTAASLVGCNLAKAALDATILGCLDLSKATGLEAAQHFGPSQISTDTLVMSKAAIPAVFLRGCGLRDWEIELVKLYKPDLSHNEFIDIQNRIIDLRNWQALQISALFISYSRADAEFVDKIGDSLTKKGIRYWRDIHEMKAGRIERQIDRAIQQNPTLLLVLSEHSVKSDWVEHEVRMARALEKETRRDGFCPVALDDSWQKSPWPQRIMEQIMEYNILDFSAWQDDSKFDSMFRKLIDGLELFYKG